MGRGSKIGPESLKFCKILPGTGTGCGDGEGEEGTGNFGNGFPGITLGKAFLGPSLGVPLGFGVRFEI